MPRCEVDVNQPQSWPAGNPRPALRSLGGLRGFTIGEMMLVVGILGLLMAIAIPVFLGQRTGAQDAQVNTSLRNVALETRTLAVAPPGSDQSVFPGPDTNGLLTELAKLGDGTYELLDAEAADDAGYSDDPNRISVLRMPDGQRAVYAALSASGTCWYVTDNLSGALQYGQYPSDAPALPCTAANITTNELDPQAFAFTDIAGDEWAAATDLSE